MRNWVSGVLMVPVLAVAQAGFPTEFPEGAAVLAPSELQKRLTGQVVNMTYANGTKVRVEYKDTYAYLNTGNAQDSGKWRTEGSQVCIDWARFTAVCFEVRDVKGTLYAKRTANGEIVAMPLQ